MYDTEKIDALIKTARNLKREVSAGKKNAQNPKRQEDANWCFRQAQRYAHEIHCLAVEMGCATPEEWRYGEKIIGMKMGREWKDFRRRPEGR